VRPLAGRGRTRGGNTSIDIASAALIESGHRIPKERSDEAPHEGADRDRIQPRHLAERHPSEQHHQADRDDDDADVDPKVVSDASASCTKAPVPQ
jgi:hypothetical protein